MTISPDDEAIAASTPHDGRRARGLGAYLRIREGAVGVVLFLLMTLVMVVGPLVAPYGPNEINWAPAEGPSAENWLGTDMLGRDVFSRFLYGGRSVILLPLIAVLLSIALACVVGLLAGYLGGWFDAVVTRVVDVFLSIPPFLTALVLLAGFGTGNIAVTVCVAVVYVPSVTRVLRAATQSVRPREYIMSARARGESTSWIIGREIVPNIAPTLLVEIALRLTFAIMFIASLSFLGLGVQPPTANWGVMVAENRALLFIHPLPVLVPTLAIGLLAISINLIADALAQYHGDEVRGEVML